MPVSTWPATRLPRATSLVNTQPPKPKSESLASATAAFSSLTRKKSATGPKNSSLEAGLSGLMSDRIVASMKASRSTDAVAAHHQRGAVVDGLFDLVDQIYQSLFRGEGAERRRLVHWIAWLQRRQRCLELFQKAVGQFVDDDKAFRRDAALPRVV